MQVAFASRLPVLPHPSCVVKRLFFLLQGEDEFEQQEPLQNRREDEGKEKGKKVLELKNLVEQQQTEHLGERYEFGSVLERGAGQRVGRSRSASGIAAAWAVPALWVLWGRLVGQCTCSPRSLNDRGFSPGIADSKGKRRPPNHSRCLQPSLKKTSRWGAEGILKQVLLWKQVRHRTCRLIVGSVLFSRCCVTV